MVSLAKFNVLTMSWDVLKLCTLAEAQRALVYYKRIMPTADVQIVNFYSL